MSVENQSTLGLESWQDDVPCGCPPCPYDVRELFSLGKSRQEDPRLSARCLWHWVVVLPDKV